MKLELSSGRCWSKSSLLMAPCHHSSPWCTVAPCLSILLHPCDGCWSVWASCPTRSLFSARPLAQRTLVLDLEHRWSPSFTNCSHRRSVEPWCSNLVVERTSLCAPLRHSCCLPYTIIYQTLSLSMHLQELVQGIAWRWSLCLHRRLAEE